MAKVINENQRNWDAHLPKVLFAYRTAVHEATKFTPYHLMFGRSPNLPVDAMMGTLPTDNWEQIDMPQFVQDLHHSLKEMYNTVREHLSASHQSQKDKYSTTLIVRTSFIQTSWRPESALSCMCRRRGQ